MGRDLEANFDLTLAAVKTLQLGMVPGDVDAEGVHGPVALDADGTLVLGVVVKVQVQEVGLDVSRPLEEFLANSANEAALK